MSDYDKHVDYVTSQVKDWYDNTMPEVLQRWINEIRATNEITGKTDEYQDDDIEYLAGKMEEFAANRLLPTGENIIRNLLSDALSEADWPELAMQYLYPPEGS